MRICKWLQQNAIDDAEYGSVRADAQSKRQDGDGRKPGVAAQKTYGITQVAPQCVEPADGVGLINLFDSSRQIPHLAQRGGTGLPGRQPVLQKRFCRDLKMRLYLLTPFTGLFLRVEENSRFVSSCRPHHELDGPDHLVKRRRL